MSEMKTIKFKGTDYVEVKERIKHFRSNEQYKGWSLDSEIISHEKDMIVMKGIIKDESCRLVASGTAYEKADSSFINKTSYIENCETSAWGRALGNLGIGIDAGIASLEEMQNTEEPDNKQIEAQKEIKECKDVEKLKKYYEKNKDKNISNFNVMINARKTELEKGQNETDNS